MIDRLFDFFEHLISDEIPEEDAAEAIALAAASLMMEVARSDNDKQEIELKKIGAILRDNFSVNPSTVNALLASASDRVEAAHDLYQFTQLINDNYSYQDKEALILSMWEVAYADGRIEAIEDHIIRRVAGLVHIAHADFIRLKIQARET
ncbi:MAG: TerB family tellurite resistance protein [Pseudomonadales bacterium]|nr:TerB family tellurite resistance protein [Pseudomonadales bacterium]MBO6595679.1 TerB family tellurite resistance protein [Pseudomonadales bacterium]MBO6657387.1 TerB family tellurite resistance protein [Pseudomonadales bacterium]MBO6702179.1 TerB family tellurite resistance protein [Pseudomonadales bacterium]MBO6820763.1 TerB family tellurite resistance protein [Pseudomonadales bacterium]